ncbi:MAG: hypothetical protein ACYTGB_19085, partial [Planctomycetota bacterium]
WHNLALAIKDAADELGLKLGRDLHLVGWCAEEAVDEIYTLVFGKAALPPLVTWSVRTMAETVVARLAERRENPDLPALRVKVPVTLRVTDG